MKRTKKMLSLLLVSCLGLGLAACDSQGDVQQSGEQPVILAVSFGSSYNETREATIDASEAALQAAYPEYEVRRAFTSQIVIDILEEREQMEIDNVTEAMDRLVADGVKDVIVQPTHVIPGFEYDDVIKEISGYADKFDSMKVGDPLLTSDKDYDTMVEVLKEETAAYNAEGTAIVFMGHGTHHEANESYTRIEKRLHAAGLTNYFVGTVEGAPLVDEVLAKVDAGDYDKVVLLPLMIVAGDHANNDMAGDEEDSWKTVFTNAGYEVECVLNGLGQYEGIQKMIVDHAAAAMEEQKPVLLTVSFGTSYNDNRDLSIGAVETALADAYPEYEVRRAFTAQIVIDILEDRDGHDIDNVEEAMERLVADGVKEVVVMPTHVMNGFEYDDIVKEVSKYADKFDSLKIGAGLLTDAADYEEVVKVLAEETAAYNTEKTAVVFMGHGTHHEANATYTTLQEALNAAGYNNYFVGTVEGAPLVDEVLAKVNAGDYDKVVLLPLMIVAGDHANNDMAGDEEDSWKTVFTNAGYEVECVLTGLGQYEGIQKMIVDHAGETIAE